MSNSTQHKLSKVRPPRVQITYDVEIGDDVQMKELPLVVGVMSDLGGQSEKQQPKLKDRKFIDIDSDNFDSVIKSIEPRITLSVDNKLTNNDTKLNMELKFSKIDDFKPLNVVKQVPALNKLFEARSHLVDLLGKLDGNDKLDEMLSEIVNNTPELEEIKAATAAKAPEETVTLSDDEDVADDEGKESTPDDKPKKKK
ncbi:type VI secretion system contractile sheath small subunit [bacterium]|nr:type VI secretion system contractile sheath small subunit [bacterium]